ncbi:hypothetical protein [Ramlibacter sp.]|uniref:hypothetical protein n=1 Tax=Ramlibacter sp. TaxID=1917967 RepID=UPI0035AF6C6B
MTRRLVSVVIALLAATAAHADDEAAERARIGVERATVEQRFAAEERDCQTRFAVNDCLRAARKRRADAMADLRRQEQTLDDAARRQRAAQRQVELDERQSPERREAEARERRERLAAQAERQAQAEQEAARRAARAASAARSPEADRVRSRQTDAEAARRNREAFEAREREARERKARVLERAAKPRKAASALPPPAR